MVFIKRTKYSHFSKLSSIRYKLLVPHSERYEHVKKIQNITGSSTYLHLIPLSLFCHSICLAFLYDFQNKYIWLLDNILITLF